jgi:hypothetical protein
LWVELCLEQILIGWYIFLAAGMGGGDQPPTPPPNFNKPTPASHPIIIETYTAAPKIEDGSSDDQSSMHSSQRESLATDDGNYQPQSPRSSLH